MTVDELNSIICDVEEMLMYLSFGSLELINWIETLEQNSGFTTA